VRECAGSQFYDGHNDVAWLPLSGCCTLGVTWYGTQVDEADMALNTKFAWSTNGQDYDVESVLLHENGHVAGLGHSQVEQAVMYAYYSGALRTLHQDDIEGITSVYPESAGADAGAGGGECTLGQAGEFCTSGSECCSGTCTGKPNAKSCK
jgi:hypothetical protein